MARPTKNNADWFPHDSNMRSHWKVARLRTKFGALEGYALYCMLVEKITSSHNFRIKIDKKNIEFLALDFGTDENLLNKFIDSAITLELFQLKNGELECISLMERLEPLLKKRKKYNEFSEVSAEKTPISDGKTPISDEKIYVSDDSRQFQGVSESFLKKEYSTVTVEKSTEEKEITTTTTFDFENFYGKEKIQEIENKIFAKYNNYSRDDIAGLIANFKEYHKNTQYAKIRGKPIEQYEKFLNHWITQDITKFNKIKPISNEKHKSIGNINSEKSKRAAEIIAERKSKVAN